MTTKDVQSYLSTNYSEHKKTVSELSKSDQGKVLVVDERELYCFDDITEEIYPLNKPQSADAFYATNSKIFFVEYKSGFKKNITKENFDKREMTCPNDESKYCEAYGELFFKNKKNEDKILRHSIQFKAVESYMTLMKGILPKCEEECKNKTLVYCVVVDDYIESMEDILNGLAKKKSETNTMTNLRNSLSRFRINEQKDYYYNDIKVFSPHEFVKFLDDNMDSPESKTNI